MNETNNNTPQQDELSGWVMDHVDKWRDDYESNYQDKHEEYYRLWRGIWAESDKTRDSERSKLISPALQQAVESAVAEVEEATFGRGKWFDIKDDRQDQDQADVAFLREQLVEDFQFTKTRKAIAECILTSAVYGSGVAEIVIEEVKEMKPATQPIMDGAMQAVGVNIVNRTVVKHRPILPQNFLIDPVASCIEDALGVAIDEFVPKHQVEINIQNGIYRDVEIGDAPTDTDLEPDQELTVYPEDKVRLTKYFGLVPRNLLNKAMMSEDGEEADVSDITEAEEDEDETLVEAIVIIGNGGTLLKVEENPYMMQDRPVVAFSWDVVPGRFWGRGICEKGYNSQKALDTELRARIDALALTTHPMMAIDATRLPRGTKLDIRPGKTILTNGNPAEVLMPLKFGSLDQVTFAQAGELQRMVQMATGAIDAAGIPGSINGEAAAGAVSMSLGAIIKRHKRTLINFQESYLIPLIQKTAWRYMQFDPEHYPVQDFKFVASSSLGVIAREYEVTQLVQLLQTLGQDSPIYPMLVTAVIDNMGLSNREEMIAQIKQLSQPSPEQQQAQQQAQQMEMRLQEAQVSEVESKAMKQQAEAQKAVVDAQLAPDIARAKIIAAASNNLNEDDESADFERRMKLADLMLKEKAIDQDREIVQMQTQAKARDTANNFVSKLSKELGDGS
jgi:hypothetical protein